VGCAGSVMMMAEEELQGGAGSRLEVVVIDVAVRRTVD